MILRRNREKICSPTVRLAPEAFRSKMKKMGLKSHFFIVNIWSHRLEFFQKLILFPCQVIGVIPQSQRKKSGIDDFQGNSHFLGQGHQKSKIRVKNGLQKPQKPSFYIKNIPNNSFLAKKHIPKNFIPQTFKIALSAVLKGCWSLTPLAVNKMGNLWQ